MKYDSFKDTIKHIQRVQQLGLKYVTKLTGNILNHDKSKLESPEKDVFDEFTPKLKECTYGSDEYKSYLKSMGVALDHHYQENSHHPEHHGKIQDMPLWDITEMLIDWIGASERHDNGNIGRSIEYNSKRFEYSHELKWILINTVMGMFKHTAWIGIGGKFAIYYGDTIKEFHKCIEKDVEMKEFGKYVMDGYYDRFYDDNGNYTYCNRSITVDNCMEIVWNVN